MSLEYGAALPEQLRSGYDYPVFGSNGVVGHHTQFLVSGPGVVVGRKGSVGEVRWSQEHFWPIDTAYYVQPKNGCDLRWLYWALKHARLNELDAATGVPGLNRSDVYRVSALACNPDEQAHIALVLDVLDNAAEKTKTLIAKLNQARTGLLHDLLTKGLDETGDIRDTLGHPATFRETAIGKFPISWSVEKLGARLLRCRGHIQTGPFGSQLHASDYVSEGVPVVMPQDINAGTVCEANIARISYAKADGLGRHKLQPTDLVFARRGDLRRCAMINRRETGWLCGTGCLLMRFEPTEMLAGWLSVAYGHDICQRQVAARAVGTTMPNLNTDLLNHLVLAFPPKFEQKAIIDAVAEMDGRIAAEVSGLVKLESLRAGLADDLLSGRGRVSAELELA